MIIILKTKNQSPSLTSTHIRALLIYPHLIPNFKAQIHSNIHLINIDSSKRFGDIISMEPLKIQLFISLAPIKIIKIRISSWLIKAKIILVNRCLNLHRIINIMLFRTKCRKMVLVTFPTPLTRCALCLQKLGTISKTSLKATSSKLDVFSIARDRPKPTGMIWSIELVLLSKK